MTFALGQRWISDTESELGLGTIISVEGRMLTLLFPASGETRLYAQAEAPLTRVRFSEGDQIKSAEGFSIIVSAVQESQQTLIYLGRHCDSGEQVALKEIFLDHFISFNQPQDRLFNGQIDRSDWFSLRYNSWQHRYRQQQNPLLGLLGGRISLIPHQLYIAREVSQRYAPRVLLADEVGLGKTIEAGLIIHQQIRSGLASRVLIIVPESLQHQWLVEMLRRFNLHFSVFDQDRCQQSQADSDNPFDTEQLVLCSLAFLTENPQWHELAVSSDWDLLVVDEAHHLQWSQQAPSEEYQCIEQLAAKIPGLILLTATPDQLGHESHFARLRLLDPARFHDYQRFIAEEQHYQQIAVLARAILADSTLTPDQSHTLQQVISETDITAQLSLLNAADTGPEVKEAARQHLISLLLDRHGTGRILFRNSRASIKGFPQRQVHFYPLELPQQYQTLLNVYTNLNKQATPIAQAEASLYPEQLYLSINSNGNWWQYDPRVDALIHCLKQYKPAKFLVICRHAATALSLEEALRQKEGIRTTVFHEGMSIVERDKAAAYFAQEQYSAQVLICSEIGSEGRNFQFAHHLVLFDLPLNPDLLEQRIGRLDRIGQKADIQIHLPYFQQHAQEILLNWYHQGLNAFTQTCQTGSTVYEEYQPQLLSLLAQVSPDQQAVATLIEQAKQKNLSLKQQLEQGRDKLLEINSSGGNQAAELARQIQLQDQSPDLAMLMFSAWDLYGVNQDDRDNSIVLTPSEQLQAPYPGLDDDGTSVTFDRATALAQEDIQLLTWDHPMVQTTLDMVTSNSAGNSAVALLPNKTLPAGSYFLECLFIAEASAPPQLQLERYLPATPVRLLLDKAANELAEKVAFSQLDPQLKTVEHKTAVKLVKALQPALQPLIQRATTITAQKLSAIKTRALEQMHQTLNTEQERLTALQKLNPAIRNEEIAYLRNSQQQLTDYISKARVKLDAIRLIVVSHG